MNDRTRDRVRDQAIVSRLRTIATRTWAPPTGQERDARLAELAAAAGGRTDLMVEAAGVMLGVRPDDEHDPRHIQYTAGAEMLLELAGAAAEDRAVRRWAEVGRERRDRRRGPEPDRGW